MHHPLHGINSGSMPLFLSFRPANIVSAGQSTRAGSGAGILITISEISLVVILRDRLAISMAIALQCFRSFPHSTFATVRQ
jgi:hypothetical protein